MVTAPRIKTKTLNDQIPITIKNKKKSVKIGE
jgi:hypothetical protein